MKVLFAVKSEAISEAIISRYRKEYQEIITYKNVYYFNAILKEIQKNKDYDRIIISEDLESFANNNNYDTIDKFIFEKLDSISDEANDSNGNEIVILFLCSERRQKGNELLSKLFSIGIYNALLGDDRSVTGVCKLIREPRTKKEAKNYYKIDSETSGYRPENENEVSEVEIQNILTHFRKLGKETGKYVASFDNIAAQYSEEQLKIIANCLPIKVKNILASSSEKYKRLAANTFGLGGVNQNKYEDNAKSSGIKIDTLSGTTSKNKINKPIVIPSGVKKVTSKKNNLEEKDSNNSGIKVQRKPKSLQEQIERTNIDESERKEALRKQKVLEEKEQAKSKAKVEKEEKDKLDEITDKKIKKNSKLEKNLDEKDDLFLTEEVSDSDTTKVNSKQLENDDIFSEDFDNLEDIEIEKSKEKKSAKMSKDELAEEDMFVSDFDDIEIEELEEPKTVPANEKLEDDDDIFADDFDDFDDIEIEESEEPKAIPSNEKLEEDDDMFADDFDDFDDIEIEESEEPKAIPSNEKLEEDDDMFADDFDDFDFEDIEIEKPKAVPSNEKAEEAEDDMFADDFDDFDFGDIEIEEPKAVPVNEKTEDDDIFTGDFDFGDIELEEPKVVSNEDKSEEDDDIFGEELGDFAFEDVEDDKEKDVMSNDELEDELEDLFDDSDLLPNIENFDDNSENVDDIIAGIDDLDDDIFEATPESLNEEDDDDIFGEGATVPGIDDLDDDIFGEGATVPGIDDLDDDIFEATPESLNEEDDDDIFGEGIAVPGINDLDDDIFETTPGTISDEEDDDIFGEGAAVPGIDDLDDDIFGEGAAVPEIDDLDDDIFETTTGTISDEEDIFEEELSTKKVDLAEEDDIFSNKVNESIPAKKSNNSKEASIKSKVEYSVNNLSKLLTKEKKIVNFIGTTKNGTSFLVNNLAKLFSSIGINTAILDLTTNKNSYYIFTNSEEKLRKIASTSFDKLEKGYAEGIKVDKNLTVYTAIPNADNKTYNAENILSTLVQNHSLVLVDCDYSTDYMYFALCQELYLVQSMDILTMQPLTTFLRELQVREILDSEKIRVVINKELKVRDLNPKLIIGGMSCYKDPGMSVMVKLFNKDMVQACSIPFEENTYSKYLEAMVNCEISLSGYSKNFMAKLKNLGDMIYPLNSKPSYSNRTISQNYKPNTFSNDMNKTLNQMKKKY
ncbi:MAG: hypothetical protein J6J60_03245 [Clostridia bacterium]|nr:hypothetical protein [Clostridia bacterium]